MCSYKHRCLFMVQVCICYDFFFLKDFAGLMRSKCTVSEVVASGGLLVQTKYFGLHWCWLHLQLSRGQRDSNGLLLLVHHTLLTNYGRKTSVLFPGHFNSASPAEGLAKPYIFLQPTMSSSFHL